MKQFELFCGFRPILLNEIEGHFNFYSVHIQNQIQVYNWIHKSLSYIHCAVFDFGLISIRFSEFDLIIRILRGSFVFNLLTFQKTFEYSSSPPNPFDHQNPSGFKKEEEKLVLFVSNFKFESIILCIEFYFRDYGQLEFLNPLQFSVFCSIPLNKIVFCLFISKFELKGLFNLVFFVAGYGLQSLCDGRRWWFVARMVGGSGGGGFLKVFPEVKSGNGIEFEMIKLHLISLFQVTSID